MKHHTLALTGLLALGLAVPAAFAGELGGIVVTASSPGLIAGNVRIEART